MVDDIVMTDQEIEEQELPDFTEKLAKHGQKVYFKIPDRTRSCNLALICSTFGVDYDPTNTIEIPLKRINNWVKLQNNRPVPEFLYHHTFLKECCYVKDTTGKAVCRNYGVLSKVPLIIDNDHAPEEFYDDVDYDDPRTVYTYSRNITKRRDEVQADWVQEDVFHLGVTTRRMSHRRNSKYIHGIILNRNRL
jgi:hypothetical protein